MEVNYGRLIYYLIRKRSTNPESRSLAMRDREETAGPLWSCGEVMLEVQAAARVSDRIVDIRTTRPELRCGPSSEVNAAGRIGATDWRLSTNDTPDILRRVGSPPGAGIKKPQYRYSRHTFGHLRGWALLLTAGALPIVRTYFAAARTAEIWARNTDRPDILTLWSLSGKAC
jgi:hypothetical protein